VLISAHFLYFGSSAPAIPPDILAKMGYQNRRNYRVFHDSQFDNLIAWLEETFADSLNLVLADPFDFESSTRRYSAHDNKIR
jgi:hypothetical protein